MSAPLSIERVEAVLVAHSGDAIATRDQIIAEAEWISSIESPADGEMAVEWLRKIKGMLKLAESSRVEVKAPVLAIAKKIDALKEEFCSPLEQQAKRLTDLISKWQLEQQRAAGEAERLRRAELERIERERLAKQREEEARVAALKKAEDDKRQAEEEARLVITPPEQAEAKAKLEAAELERRKAKADVQESRADQRELVAQKSFMAPIPVPKPAGLVNKPVWKFEVTSIDQLVAARLDLCNVEASASRINEEIRAGMRECPGLRIWSEQQTTVRV